MRNARIHKITYGSLKSKKARALVENLEKRSIKKNPLLSRILIATGTSIALIVVGAMLTKIKSPASGEIQKETPVKIKKNNEKKMRIKQLQNVIRTRAKLKERLTWTTDPGTGVEYLKEEMEEETEALKNRLALLQNHKKELDVDLDAAKDEQNLLFDKLLRKNPITKETVSRYSVVSAQLEDMHALTEKIDAAIQKTEEELRKVQIVWLVKSPEYTVDARGIGYRVKPKDGFNKY